MNTNRTKIIAIIFFAFALLLGMIFRVAPATLAAGNADDPAATYKTKCAACHTPTASKFFDATKTDADLVQIVLKGKKGEKPPFMPAFSEKGISEDDAKALVTFMKGLKAPAN